MLASWENWEKERPFRVGFSKSFRYKSTHRSSHDLKLRDASGKDGIPWQSARVMRLWRSTLERVVEANSGMRHVDTSVANQAVWRLWAGLFFLVSIPACGTTQSQLATQQLIMSDAVDRAVAKLDFRVLSGKRVFLDDRYIQNIKGLGFVNSEYIISAVRQQLLAAGCLLQDSADKADYIVEARVGALGTDQHDVTYGIPASKALSTLADVIPNVPDLPTIPELSVARRSDQFGAAKIAVYAYHRATRTPVWQSGTSVAISDAKNSWILGIGPFQTGTIYPAPRFAGERLLSPFRRRRDEVRPGLVPLHEEYTFSSPSGARELVTDEVQTAKHEEPVESSSTSDPPPSQRRPSGERHAPAASDSRPPQPPPPTRSDDASTGGSTTVPTSAN
jgi:hypothetical protein